MTSKWLNYFLKKKKKKVIELLRGTSYNLFCHVWQPLNFGTCQVGSGSNLVSGFLWVRRKRTHLLPIPFALKTITDFLCLNERKPCSSLSPTHSLSLSLSLIIRIDGLHCVCRVQIDPLTALFNLEIVIRSLFFLSELEYCIFSLFLFSQRKLWSLFWIHVLCLEIWDSPHISTSGSPPLLWVNENNLSWVFTASSQRSAIIEAAVGGIALKFWIQVWAAREVLRV